MKPLHFQFILLLVILLAGCFGNNASVATASDEQFSIKCYAGDKMVVDLTASRYSFSSGYVAWTDLQGKKGLSTVRCVVREL